MRGGTKISLAALAAVSLAVPAWGQDAPWSAEGRLEDGDRATQEDNRYDEHVVRLEAGRRYRITASSEDFDTRIELYGTASEPIAENDDYGGELNSRINITPESTAEYRLRVLAYSSESRGAYTLRAEPLPPLPDPIASAGSAAQPTGWAVWEGELAASDAERDGMHFDDYRIRFRAGQTRILSAESADFDPLVLVMAPGEREGEWIDIDDDAGPGLQAMLGFRPEADGDFLVRVTSFNAGGTGRYRLRVSDELTPPPPADPQPAEASGD